MYLCTQTGSLAVVRKAGVLLCFLLLLSLSGIAQNVNGWVNFGQQYYKIPVVKDGIYRVSYATLQAAGFPVTAIDPRVVQLVHRGAEQAIFVQGESDARFDVADYIEFYGQRNDGTLDSALYQPSSLQPHRYYNLYSDTAAYFLTWNLSGTRGKRIASFFQNNTTNIPKETSQLHTELNVYHTEYSGGNTIGGGEIQSSSFDEGEGWTDNYICYSPVSASGCPGFKDYSIDNLSNGVAGGTNPVLDILIAGRDELSHMTEIYVGPAAGSLRLIASGAFSNFQLQHITTDLAWSDISASGKLVVEIKALGANGLRDKISVSFIRIIMPQGFDVTGQTTKVLELNPNPSNKSYVEFLSPAAGLRLWDITDPYNTTSIGTNTSTGILSAVIPNTNTARQLLLSNEFTNASLNPVVFQQILPGTYDYIVITHSSLLTGAQAFAAYRSSPAGGSYSPITITVDQLYNQFNYGETSPLAIFQLLKYLASSGPPKYLFLIGKALDVSQGFYRKTSFLSTDLRDLVPTAGLPASDMAYSANLLGSGNAPAIPTGRLSASTISQVTAYLNKIKEVESTPPNILWRKQGLHLSGGILPDELTSFRAYMDGFKAVAEGEYWGGKITTIAKHDPTTVQQINISDQVNAGVNLITFFGHSSPGTIDIDIGKVSDPKLGYNNPGKYPVFLINGCNAGNFFTNGTSFGEDWMLAADKGARGFIAHSFFGYVLNLKYYSDFFYEVGLGDSTFITKGIGDVQKEVATRYLNFLGNYMTNITQVQQMVLLGDPAVKLFGTATPDYQTDDASISIVSYDKNPVTFASDSFAIRVFVRNLGAAKSIPLHIKLVRTFSDGFTENIYKTVGPVLQLDTIDFIVKNDRTSGSGSNTFTVTLDDVNAIHELNEQNNTGKASFVIPLGGTLNLFPGKYTIAPQTSVDFVFQSVNPLDVKRSFDLEIDTASTFNSASLVSKTVSGKVLLKTTISLTASDSTVYYWRTKLSQPAGNESALWTTSSFTLIRNSQAGWTQRKFDQFTENDLDGLIEDNTSHKLKFKETSSNLLVTTYGWNNPASYLDVSVKLNGTEFNIATENDPCRNNTLNFIAFNKTSLVPYPALDLGFQSINTCGREPQVINSFTAGEMDNGSDHDVLALIDNVKPGDSVLVFSIGNVNHAGWSSALRTKLALLGIDDAALSSLGTGQPLIIFGRKDAPTGTANVYLINSDTAKLQVNKTITGRYTSGTMNSVLIGPASHWKQALLKPASVEAGDVYTFELWGIALDGTSTLLSPNITSPFDLSSVNAALYPWISIRLTTEDQTNLTPVQLSQWLVFYDPMPEGVLLFNGPAEQQLLSEGQPWTGGYKFVNISAQAYTDSLTVDFDVRTSGISKESKIFKIKAPVPGDTTAFSVATQSKGKSGLNDVDVFVNPRILPEQYYQNNRIDLAGYLNVKADQTSPLLDVSFDGRHLSNGDFVSPNPRIVILVNDDNKYLLKTDTAGMSIVLTSPCTTGDCPATPIYFTRTDIRWVPATQTKGFTVEFTPANLQDGEYSLFVQAADASGNASGPEPYEISFQVKNEMTFAFKEVYPNPSTSNFFFNFVLTGNTTPDQFDLKIFSLDGRVLAEFTQSDIANFHIGDNQLFWDSNENSNTAPSGLYIYRLNIAVGGKNFKSVGKLVLVH